MNSLTILDKNKHNDLRIDLAKRQSHAADQRLMPVMLSEFQRCAIHFPIILTKNAETGKFTCAAVFGFEQGENLFWKEDKWDALYTPLNMQRQPFFLANKGDGESADNADDFLICLNEESDCITSDERGQAVFDKDEPTEYLKEVQKVMRDLLVGEKQTELFLEKMTEMDLIAPLALDITFRNQQKQRIDGAYTINEDKLKELDKEQAFELYSSGYLSVIYTIYVSLGQLYPLIERKNVALEKAGDWFKNTKT